MTKHSQENLVKFLEQGIIDRKDAAQLLEKCRKALSLSKYRQSTAVVIKLTAKVSKSYSHRDYWADNDTLCAIIRNGKVVTVMLTRSSQVNQDHFRVEFIFK